jgi:hypothetical protein
VGPSAARLLAAAEPRATGGILVPPPPAEAALPADVAIGYRLLPGRRPRRPGRPLRRGPATPATVRISLSCPAGHAAPELPEFVLVARGGEPGAAAAPPRPLHSSDGTVVLRLSGAELRRDGVVERQIAPDACTPPYVLRGFLLGGGAAAVRLHEPSPATLVVR